MKRHRLMLFPIVMFIMLFQINPFVFAQIKVRHDEDRHVTVSYIPDLKCSLSVHVSGNGVVIDGSQSIRNGIVQYDFLSPAQKYFVIRADNGYRLKSVGYESAASIETENWIEQVINQTMTIHIGEGTAHLYIEFEIIPPHTDDDIPEEDNPEGNTSGGNNSGSSKPDDKIPDQNINGGDNAKPPSSPEQNITESEHVSTGNSLNKWYDYGLIISSAFIIYWSMSFKRSHSKNAYKRK